MFTYFLNLLSGYRHVLPESDYNDQNFFLLPLVFGVFRLPETFGPFPFLWFRRDVRKVFPYVGVVSHSRHNLKSRCLVIVLCKHNKFGNVIPLNNLVVTFLLYSWLRFKKQKNKKSKNDGTVEVPLRKRVVTCRVEYSGFFRDQ